MAHLGSLDFLSATFARHPVSSRIGRVREVTASGLSVSGISDVASVGDRVLLNRDPQISGEIVGVDKTLVRVMVDGQPLGLRIGQAVRHLGPVRLHPDRTWLGRIVDSEGRPLDGKPLLQGEKPAVSDGPPAAAERRPFGQRLRTGYALFNTILPIVRGQRIGVFSGSGVGKSSLLASFARDLEADVVVIAMIGERGREVGNFVTRVLGKKGLGRSVVVAETSDRSALSRRRAASSAMAIAEHFRDDGKHVLLLVDSVTRLAEAHREIAVSTGESAAMRGYPPSLVPLLASFCERAGPGADGQGDITAIFTVLVSGSDMEEPVADTLRGLLDGHVVLSRAIAERGRFPAVDVLQSVSRSLPDAATEAENALISEARRVLSTYEASEIMVRSGLYQPGGNPELDRAVAIFESLDAFAARRDEEGISASFRDLETVLQPASED